MKSILTIGEILVEIMATDKGDGFLEPVNLVGPFPSGAPAIFIDQAAKFGQPAAIIGCVGNDDFGRVNLDRLRRDGVNVEGVRIEREMATGSAFVRYRHDGSRAFVYNIKHSASGAIALDAAAKAVLNRSDHLHVMGTALFSPRIVEVVLGAAAAIKARGGTISFDPNLRLEILNLPGLREACETLFRRCDLFLPSGAELYLFTNAKEEKAAVVEILGRGVRAIVDKRGADGAVYFELGDEPYAARVQCRGGGSDGGWRLLWRHLRQLLAAQHASGTVFGLRGGEWSVGGDAARTDGRRRQPSRSRCFHGDSFRKAVVMTRPLPPLVSERLTDGRAGVTSVCTAHPVVIEAALSLGLRTGRRVLIEATCNQVNQEGGYTGMTPADFRQFVGAIASRVGLDPSRIIFGGDHLGPNPWKHLAAGEAMQRAKAMIEAYARAGFAKLHLDTSMGCAGEPVALADHVTAERAADLAKVAEGAVGNGPAPVYIIGTEVPVPGGAQHALNSLEVTRPEAALQTIDVHRKAFSNAALEPAFARAIGVVVQPGVEFASAEVIPYKPHKAERLTGALARLPGFVFEAHSTDYQPAVCLEALVRDGFAILKVGPWLTFALREALYGLDCIARVLDPTSTNESSPSRDGSADAEGARQLAQILRRQPRRAQAAAALQFQRPHSILLASSRGSGRCRPVVCQARRQANPRASHQPIFGRSFPRGGQRLALRAAQGACGRRRASSPAPIRSGVRSQLAHRAPHDCPDGRKLQSFLGETVLRPFATSVPGAPSGRIEGAVASRLPHDPDLQRSASGSSYQGARPRQTCTRRRQSLRRLRRRRPARPPTR